MRICRYAILHACRNIRSTFIVLLSYVAILAFILSIQQSTRSRQEMLQDSANAMAISCHISDVSGIMSDGLEIGEAYVEQLTEEYGTLFHMIRNVNVCARYPFSGYDEKEYLVTGITREEADSRLIHSGAITYENGYDATIWEEDKAVCVLGGSLLNLTYIGQDGFRYFDLYTKVYSYTEEEKDFSLRLLSSLQVIGEVDDQEAVYVPYRTLKAVHSNINDAIPFTVDSLSFLVKDNHQLDQLRERAGYWFADVSWINEAQSSMEYSLVINDAAYLELIQEAKRSLKIIQLMQPVLYLCSLGAGVMLIVMQMRGRKKEMAVIRSLGTGEIRVMAQTILEYALICLPVTLFALLIWRELSPLTVLGVWMAFMAGALCTVARFSMVPLVKQIRELEE